MAAFPCIHLYDDVHNTIDVIRSLCQKSVPEKESEDELSEREKEILCAVAKGLINKEISDEYNISIHTVITHRKNITAKLGIKSISGLTAYALLNDFIMMDDIK
jgi:DNA-binding CsgD family transcriptional regulator